MKTSITDHPSQGTSTSSPNQGTEEPSPKASSESAVKEEKEEESAPGSPRRSLKRAADVHPADRVAPRTRQEDTELEIREMEAALNKRADIIGVPKALREMRRDVGRGMIPVLVGAGQKMHICKLCGKATKEANNGVYYRCAKHAALIGNVDRNTSKVYIDASREEIDAFLRG
jgi:hypothetical protein